MLNLSENINFYWLHENLLGISNLSFLLSYKQFTLNAKLGTSPRVDLGLLRLLRSYHLHMDVVPRPSGI